MYDPFDDQLLITVGKDNLFDITTYPLAIKHNGGDHIEDVLNLSYELATTPIDDRGEVKRYRYRMVSPIKYRPGVDHETVALINNTIRLYLAKQPDRGWFIVSDNDISQGGWISLRDTIFTEDDVDELDTQGGTVTGFVAEPFNERLGRRV